MSKRAKIIAVVAVVALTYTLIASRSNSGDTEQDST
ncbi:MAG: hypothetical protein J07HQW2_03435 [Haloquadratum walsbyi J07HQW2]|uniref:Uncharacterized protein n=1 Tax=Haloquadratum walsbyi J07HQW2 TaxID=1238425 RepID=U1PWY5_9EURY|nr:MAG: hypothetical protein J07HQW2_03435 [Haloquadratum walsbyi J07HQW2]